MTLQAQAIDASHSRDTMTDQAGELLRNDEARLRTKGLFGELGDSLSVRLLGQRQFLLAVPDSEEARKCSFETAGIEGAGLHAAIYRARGDAGAILIGRTRWSSALATIGARVPTLFDEQARHIGKSEKPILAGSPERLLSALRGGANIAIYGDQRVCIGTTPERLVLNAELFQKCAEAFVIGHASGHRIRHVPRWVQYIASRRLRTDQKRAAQSYDAGRMPTGMNAY